MYAPNFDPKTAPKWDHYEFADVKRNAIGAGFQKFLGNFIPEKPPASWKILRDKFTAPVDIPAQQAAAPNSREASRAAISGVVLSTTICTAIYLGGSGESAKDAVSFLVAVPDRRPEHPCPGTSDMDQWTATRSESRRHCAARRDLTGIDHCATTTRCVNERNINYANLRLRM